MKPIIPIVGAFVLGLGGASFVGMRSAPPPAPPAEHVAAPSPAAPDTAVVPADSGVKAPTQADSTPAPMKEDSQIDTARPAAERLAGVFAKLAPADIVPLVEHIPDDDLVPVLKRLDLSKTAALLALLPATRSKALGKRLLVPTTKAASP